METQSKQMTREQYMALTNIKSVDEAKEYLQHLKILFPVLFLLIIIPKTIAIPAPYIFYFAGVGLLLFAYFIFYCHKVIKAEKISDASLFLSFFFAPISWIWFYPDIMGPLQIITGEKEPPVHVTPQTYEEKMAARVKANKSFGSFIIKFLIGGVIFVIALGLLLALAFKQ